MKPAVAVILGSFAAVLLAQAPGGRPGTGAIGTSGGRGGRGGGFNAEPQTVLLWENGAPGALGSADADKPNITFYRAGGRGGAGPAVIVAPGGAYRMLSTGGGEGTLACHWLNLNGINAVLLRSRIAPYRHPIELGDAQRAIRLVRSRAAEFGIDPARIGMMGFSAGGHLTATAGTHFDAGNPNAPDPIDRASSRPDFLVLAYPVISFQPSIAGPNVLTAYASSGLNLLGDHPDPKLLDDLSDELQVTPQTPPTFLVHGTADTLVTVQNSVAMYLALKKAGVPTELHTYEKAGHAFGINLTDPSLQSWPPLLMTWLRGRGIVTAPVAGGGGGGGGRGAAGASGPAGNRPN